MLFHRLAPFPDVMLDAPFDLFQLVCLCSTSWTATCGIYEGLHLQAIGEIGWPQFQAW
jgi:hypothetical protein